MLILPAIDLRGGMCVRLAQGDYGRETVYGEDPVALALQFEDAGATFLHLVDLDGAKSGVPENLAVIKRVVSALSIPIEVGGGIRTLETANALLDAGVERVVFGTALVRSPELAEEVFVELKKRAVAGIDVREGNVAVAGWQEESDWEAVRFAKKMQALGCQRIILTDISRDGMLSGPNLNLLRDLFAETDVAIIQSGGIGSLEDLTAVAQTGCAEGVIVGRAFYEGRFTVPEAILSISGHS